MPRLSRGETAATEKAVYALVMEGVDLKLWEFADLQAGWPLLWRYRKERDGEFSAAQVQAAMEKSRQIAPLKVKPVETGEGDKRSRLDPPPLGQPARAGIGGGG